LLNYRNLGKTGLKVSEIGLGCWELGGNLTINSIPLTYGNVNEKSAVEIIKKALELGINTFDTADIYSLGNSEIRLKKALENHRGKVNIFTKGGVIPANNFPLPTDVDLSYNYLLSAINRSLKRLDIKKVELFQAHKPPRNEIEFIELKRFFKKIKEDDKASFCGVSIGLDCNKGIELINRGIVDTLQVYFSLIDFKPTIDLFKLAKKNNIGIIVAEPLAQGFLTGEFQKNHKFAENDIRRISFSDKQIAEKIKRANQFKFLLKPNRNLSQVAISYILSRNEVSLCIPGTKSKKHLISNVNSFRLKLSNDELKQINEIQNKWQDK